MGVSGASDYYEQDGVKWNTNGEGIYDYQGIYKVEVNGEGGDENHLEQIWKQRYLADFFNGHAAWTLERRTRVRIYLLISMLLLIICRKVRKRLMIIFRNDWFILTEELTKK